jgi:murein L,D-transpeptidase YafK
VRKATLYKYVVVLLLAIAAGSVAHAAVKADQVVVNKSAARLYLKAQGKTIATFQVAFGAQPQGHKQQQGDERTPEGHYTLDAKNSQSDYYKSIHISYPNAVDRALASRHGVNAGGDIMIHGQPNGWGWLAPITQWLNWTDGCIALTNGDMDEVWRAVDVGTPITILP